MKIYRQICLALCLLLLLQFAAQPASADNEVTDVSVLSGCRGIDAAVPVLGSSQLIENVQSALLFEASTGTLMYAYNPDQQLHPAGLVKILTALIAIENGTLTDAVTVKESVINLISEGSRTSNLQVDEVLTLEQLLYCVLVEGSNDAALVVADHVAGSQDAFVGMMNEYAAQIGCSASNFTNVHGLHDELQLSTARDIARILAEAVKNEQFVTMYGTTFYTLEATNKSEERDLECGNHMMHQDVFEIYYDERVTGGRTGENNLGLRSLAATATLENMELISVVLGCESTVTESGIVSRIGGFDETKQLLDLGFTGYKTAQLLYENQALKQYSVQNGIADVVLGPQVSISSVIPADATVNTLTYKYNDLDDAFVAPIEKGQRMSTLEIWDGSVCLAQAELFALNDVDTYYQLIEPKKAKGLPWWGVLLIVILVVAVLAVAALFAIRFVNLRRANTAKRRAVRRRKR